MQLNKKDDIISELDKMVRFPVSQDLAHCWVMSEDEGKYNIYIFSVHLDNEDELLSIKDELRDYLAVYFQSQTLKKEVERWNIYQVFFIKGSVSKRIKQQIEQDKFSTRKLVIDGLEKELSNIEIRDKLDDLIFRFDLAKKEKRTESMIDSLQQDKQDFFNRIIDSDGDVDVLLKQLENE